jgi:hypothetical protein
LRRLALGLKFLHDRFGNPGGSSDVAWSAPTSLIDGSPKVGIKPEVLAASAIGNVCHDSPAYPIGASEAPKTRTKIEQIPEINKQAQEASGFS